MDKCAHVPLGTYASKGNSRTIELPVTVFDGTTGFQTVTDG